MRVKENEDGNIQITATRYEVDILSAALMCYETRHCEIINTILNEHADTETSLVLNYVSTFIKDAVTLGMSLMPYSQKRVILE